LFQQKLAVENNVLISAFRHKHLQNKAFRFGEHPGFALPQQATCLLALTVNEQICANPQDYMIPENGSCLCSVLPAENATEAPIRPVPFCRAAH
ncbi:unnamed protein product, partial [Dovyalis caffra]